MPSPRPISRIARTMPNRMAVALFVIALLLLAGAQSVQGQITAATNMDGRKIFVNEEPPTLIKLNPVSTPKPPKSIYLTGEIAFMNREHDRPAMSIDRD